MKRKKVNVFISLWNFSLNKTVVNLPQRPAMKHVVSPETVVPPLIQIKFIEQSASKGVSVILCEYRGCSDKTEHYSKYYMYTTPKKYNIKYTCLW